MYSFVTSMIQKNIVFASKGTQVFFSEHVSSITWRFYIEPIWNLHLKDDRIILKWKHCTSYTRFGPLERFRVKVISFSSSINLHKENRSLYCLLLEKNIERYYVMPGRRTQNLNHVTEGRRWQNFDLHFLWVPNVAAKGGSKAFPVIFELQLHPVHKSLCRISHRRLYNVWRGYSITDHSQSAQAIFCFQISYMDNGE